jgi:hypothetical protein
MARNLRQRLRRNILIVLFGFALRDMVLFLSDIFFIRGRTREIGGAGKRYCGENRRAVCDNASLVLEKFKIAAVPPHRESDWVLV